MILLHQFVYFYLRLRMSLIWLKSDHYIQMFLQFYRIKFVGLLFLKFPLKKRMSYNTLEKITENLKIFNHKSYLFIII
jgi:hypothetical protein